MNFGEVIKKEIKNKQIKDKHCQKAFLAGVIRSSGVLYFENDKLGVSFRTPDEDSALTCINYVKSLFNYDIREVSVSSRDKFTINIVGEKTAFILKELGVLKSAEIENKNIEVEFGFYGVVAQKDCCFKSFLRGLFLGAGSCTVPDGDGGTTGYHLEINFSHSKPASETLNRLDANNIKCKITRKKDSYMLYIKKAEEIKDFIAFLPAPVSVLSFMDVMIEREILNKSNRLKNCDMGNVNKQVEACARQIDAIKKIEKLKGLSFLKDELKQTAQCRIENLEDSLNELAQKLNVSKSCLNHRLRKLVAISQEIE